MFVYNIRVLIILLLLTLAKSSKKKKKILVTDNKKEIRQKQNLGIGTIVHNLVRCTSWYGMIITVSITDCSSRQQLRAALPHF